MDSEVITYIVAPLVTATIGGVAFIVKRWLAKADKRREEEMVERNKRRAEIESNIAEVKNEVKSVKRDMHKMQAIILSCDKPDCPSKMLLANYLEKKSEETEL